MKVGWVRTASAARVIAVAGVLALISAGCAIVRVSVSSSGDQANQQSPRVIAVTDDGRYSLFTSAATNLVPNDTTANIDLFRHDTKTRATVRVNVGQNGAQLEDAFDGSMSANGRYVAFVTAAALAPADTNGAPDVYVHDFTTNATTWASQPPAGGLPVGGVVNVGSISISSDGRFVSFFWSSPGPTPEFRTQTLYRRDRHLGTTTKVHDTASYLGFLASRDAHHYVLSVGCAHGCAPAPVLVDADGSGAGWPALPFGSCGFDSVSAISPTGRFLAWQSFSGRPAPCLPVGSYLVDRTTASAKPLGNVTVAGISSDGKTLLMLAAGNLASGGTPGRTDLYLHDVPTNATTRIVTSMSGHEPDADITSGALSENAHEIGFNSAADDLVVNDTNRVGDAFVLPGLHR